MSKINFEKFPDQCMAEIRARNRANLTEAVTLVYRSILRNLSGSRSGREYYIPGSTKKYTASAPGEAPARRTGALANSYRYEVEGETARVGSGINYALELEEGTSNIQPRPHFKRAFTENAGKIRKILGAE